MSLPDRVCHYKVDLPVDVREIQDANHFYHIEGFYTEVSAFVFGDMIATGASIRQICLREATQSPIIERWDHHRATETSRER